jgi:hypothetical protein
MKTNQHGATTVEFALVTILFFMVTLGIVDFSRMLYTWSAATEATRAGARYAVVCADGTAANEGAVLSRMRGVLPNINQINVDWEPAGCNAASCQGVRVGITNVQFEWLSPLSAIASAVPLPTFATYLPREVMRQDTHSNTQWCILPTPLPTPPQ